MVNTVCSHPKIFRNPYTGRHNPRNIQTAIQLMRVPDENGLDKVEAMKSDLL